MILTVSCYGKYSHQKTKMHIENEDKYKLKHFEEYKNENINIVKEKESIELEIIKFIYEFIQFM